VGFKTFMFGEKSPVLFLINAHLRGETAGRTCVSQNISLVPAARRGVVDTASMHCIPTRGIVCRHEWWIDRSSMGPGAQPRRDGTEGPKR
jgi:hypothetical protein